MTHGSTAGNKVQPLVHLVPMPVQLSHGGRFRPKSPTQINLHNLRRGNAWVGLLPGETHGRATQCSGALTHRLMRHVPSASHRQSSEPRISR
jgi:hypothetical protein